MTAYAKNKTTKENVEVYTPEEVCTETETYMDTLFGGRKKIFHFTNRAMTIVTVPAGEINQTHGDLPEEYFPNNSDLTELQNNIDVFVSTFGETFLIVAGATFDLYNNRVRLVIKLYNPTSSSISTDDERFNILMIDHRNNS